MSDFGLPDRLLQPAQEMGGDRGHETAVCDSLLAAHIELAQIQDEARSLLEINIPPFWNQNNIKH